MILHDNGAPVAGKAAGLPAARDEHWVTKHPIAQALCCESFSFCIGFTGSGIGEVMTEEADWRVVLTLDGTVLDPGPGTACLATARARRSATAGTPRRRSRLDAGRGLQPGHSVAAGCRRRTTRIHGRRTLPRPLRPRGPLRRAGAPVNGPRPDRLDAPPGDRDPARFGPSARRPPATTCAAAVIALIRHRRLHPPTGACALPSRVDGARGNETRQHASRHALGQRRPRRHRRGLAAGH